MALLREIPTPAGTSASPYTNRGGGGGGGDDGGGDDDDHNKRNGRNKAGGSLAVRRRQSLGIFFTQDQANTVLSCSAALAMQAQHTL